MFSFIKGRAYVATPTMKGPAQRVMACIERGPGCVALVDVRGLHRVDVKVVMDRETAIVKDDNGIDYFASAVVEADAADIVRCVK